MNDAHARTTASVLLATAGVAAAYVILTRPPLRRVAVRLVQPGLLVAPVHLAKEVRQAWQEPGQPRASS